MVNGGIFTPNLDYQMSRSLANFFVLFLVSLLGILPSSAIFADEAPNRITFSSSRKLERIAQSSGLLSPTITVCNLTSKCIHYQGDRPPRSAASLIKVPMAIALLEKVAKDKISLEQTIYVDPSNYTEEDWSDIQVGKSYSLRYLLTQLIAYSSNIAHNQLIDYLGWDYINYTLGRLGYANTRVRTKLIGQSTRPTKNKGSAPNRITSNELSAMMVEIYNSHHRKYDVLAQILNYQVEKVLGFDAIKSSTGRWLGEKTGENSLVRGTTLAVEINEIIYIITVTEDANKTEAQIRNCIAQIVKSIDRNQLF